MDVLQVLRDEGWLGKLPRDKSCPRGKQCNHAIAAECKQARLEFDHRQKCSKNPCDCFFPNRGIPQNSRA